MKYRVQTQTKEVTYYGPYQIMWITAVIVDTLAEAVTELDRLRAAGYPKYQARVINEDYSPIGGILDCWV